MMEQILRDFSIMNYKIFGLGVLTIFIGYFLMWTGETASIQAVKVSPVTLTTVLNISIILLIAMRRPIAS